jgi:hypothetical protein
MQVNIEKLRRDIRRARNSASALEMLKRLDSLVASVGWFRVSLAKRGQMRMETVKNQILFPRSSLSIDFYKQTTRRPGFTLFLITIKSDTQGEKMYRIFWNHEFVVKKEEEEWKDALTFFKRVKANAQLVY